ncbi:hypothetical protein RRG08_056755 [Elysia crispata]|uniref:Uncharacterized protein n=1 Tax=Elysia crispata TaxID=231223 RepID=A0AAE1DLN5_9GAST|nr:hypothetical protein RRG08_056755 [Elysia crispata]
METNRYANAQGPPEKWLPVTVADLKAFMDYWRTSKRLFQTQFGKGHATKSFPHNLEISASCSQHSSPGRESRQTG